MIAEGIATCPPHALDCFCTFGFVISLLLWQALTAAWAEDHGPMINKVFVLADSLMRIYDFWGLSVWSVGALLHGNQRRWWLLYMHGLLMARDDKFLINNLTCWPCLWSCVYCLRADDWPSPHWKCQLYIEQVSCYCLHPMIIKVFILADCLM